MTVADARRARDEALRDLDYHWGEAYDIAVTRIGWLAQRLDDGRGLRAGSPGELRALIIADYTARPVPRDVRDRALAMIAPRAAPVSGGVRRRGAGAGSSPGPPGRAAGSAR